MQRFALQCALAIRTVTPEVASSSLVVPAIYKFLVPQLLQSKLLKVFPSLRFPLFG